MNKSNVKNAMEKRNVSNAQIKRVLGVASSTVSGWRKGNRPSFINASIMGVYLGCSPLFLRGMSNEPGYTETPPCLKNDEFIRTMELFYDKGFMKGSLKTKKVFNEKLERAEKEKVEAKIKLAETAFDALTTSSAKVQFAAGLIDEPELFCSVCNKLTDVEKVRLYKKV